MIKKYTFFGGGNVYMVNLLNLVRIGIKNKKVYMVQVRGFEAMVIK